MTRGVGGARCCRRICRGICRAFWRGSAPMAVPGLPVPGALAGRLPLRRLRPPPGPGAQGAADRGVRGLWQAALAARGHDLRADQDRLGQAVSRHLLGDLEQGRDLGHGTQAAMGFGSYRDRPGPGCTRSAEGESVGPRAGPGSGPAARPRSPGRSRAVAAKPAAIAWAGQTAVGARRLGREPRTLFSARTSPGRRPWRPTAGQANTGLAAAGYRHEPLNLSASWGDAALRLPAIHLVFGLAQALAARHPSWRGQAPSTCRPVSTSSSSCFNRRTAKSLSHRFARVIEQAVLTRPTTYPCLCRSPEGHGELVEKFQARTDRAHRHSDTRRPGRGGERGALHGQVRPRGRPWTRIRIS